MARTKNVARTSTGGKTKKSKSTTKTTKSKSKTVPKKIAIRTKGSPESFEGSSEERSEEISEISESPIKIPTPKSPVKKTKKVKKSTPSPKKTPVKAKIVRKKVKTPSPSSEDSPSTKGDDEFSIWDMFERQGPRGRIVKFPSPEVGHTPLIKYALLADIKTIREKLKVTGKNAVPRIEVIQAYEALFDADGNLVGSEAVRKELSHNKYIVSYLAARNPGEGKADTPRGAKRGPALHFYKERSPEVPAVQKENLADLVKMLTASKKLPKAKAPAKKASAKKVAAKTTVKKAKKSVNKTLPKTSPKAEKIKKEELKKAAKTKTKVVKKKTNTKK